MPAKEKPTNWSTRVVVTDGELVALTRNRDNGRIKMFGGRLKPSEGRAEGASREFREEIGEYRCDLLQSTDLLPSPSRFEELPEQDDAENTAVWSLLRVSTAVLSAIEGDIEDGEETDAASIFLVDIDRVGNELSYPYWKLWWNTLGEDAVNSSFGN